LREKGHEVRLFDTMFRRSPDEIVPVLGDFRPDLLLIYDDGFNYLTKMCLSNMREAAFAMQSHAKKAGCRVIVTSSDAADHSGNYLEHGADFVITGEAEHTLAELVAAIEAGVPDPAAGIKGLILKSVTGTLKTPPRPVSKNPDEFPLPAWDLVDIEPYRAMWLSRHGRFSINVATTRGCPYKCNWCAKPIYGNAYNMRSPASVVKELKMLGEMFAMDHVWFCDDIFGLRRSWVSEFAELVRKEGLKIRYKIQSRADLLVQEKYVDALADSGCEEVWMGAESGSQRILDAMDKGTTVGQIRKARRLLAERGIRAAYFLQFGYPGEELADIEKTIQLVKETMPDDIGISVSYPLPGTVFYENVKRGLGEKTNWRHSDELAMMFSNTYPPAFYKTLHRLVHSIFRKGKAVQTLRKKGGRGKLKAAGGYMKYSIAQAVHASRIKLQKQ
jgi:anaerobic magnesium-protoporphyrin IX monomethyl ester cyclase